MDEVVAEVAEGTGLDPATARRAAGIIIAFIDRAGPEPQVHALVDGMPGARELAKESGGRAGNLLTVFGELSDLGLGFGDVERLARTFVAAARKRVGTKEVDAVIAGVPGLGQFV